MEYGTAFGVLYLILVLIDTVIMRSSGINGEGELRGQSANPGSHEKIAVEMECVCV